MPEPGRPAAKRVWLLGDGQPGHESRSRGLLAQLEALCPLTVTWLRCELRLGFSRALLRAWLNAGAAPHSTRPLHFWYRMDALPPGTPDLILSAGGKTSFANAWLGAVSGAPNVFAGTLRRLHPALFHTVLTLEPVPGARNNLVMELLPTDIDRRQVEQQGAALRARQDRPCWLLLAGGDGAGYRWAARDWEALAAVMSRLARARGIRWYLVGSRRTGARGERILRERLDPAWLAASCWARAGERWPAEAWLGAADAVFVTEDSMSMLNEAMSAGRPVHSLRPRHSVPDPRYAAALERYAAAGRLRRHALSALEPDGAAVGEPVFTPPALPAPTPGEQLARRLGWLA